MRIRKAYEALTDPSRREAVEADEIIAAMTRAAVEADRRRATTTRSLKPIEVTLAPTPGAFGINGLPHTAAVRVAIGLLLFSWLAVLSAGAVGSSILIVLGGSGPVMAAVVWFTRRRPAAVNVFGDGFEDDRWKSAGRISWAEVRALDVDYTHAVLDLELTPSSVERLTTGSRAPRGVVVWNGSRPFYRLPLDDEFETLLRLVEARTGLIAQTASAS